MVVKLENVSAEYKKGVKAIRNVNLIVEDGETLAIIGKSGSGKTTLLRIIAGMVSCSEGKIIVAGNDISSSVSEHVNIGYVFQDQASIFPHYTAFENVEFPLKLKVRKNQYAPALRRDLVDKYLSFVGLTNKKDEKPSNMSGGEKQRLAIARALVYSPDLLLLDEPLSYLDSINKNDILDLIKKIKRELNSTIIYVTHDTREISALADKVLIVENSEVIQYGTLIELREQPNSILSAQIMGGWNLYTCYFDEEKQNLSVDNFFNLSINQINLNSHEDLTLIKGIGIKFDEINYFKNRSDTPNDELTFQCKLLSYYPRISDVELLLEYNSTVFTIYSSHISPILKDFEKNGDIYISIKDVKIFSEK